MSPLKRDRMHPNSALEGLKRHALTPVSDAFPCTLHPHQRLGISAFRPHLEGADGHNGQYCEQFRLKKSQLSNLEKDIWRNFRQPARRWRTEEVGGIFENVSAVSTVSLEKGCFYSTYNTYNYLIIR